MTALDGIGIWLDFRRALIVKFSGDAVELKELTSDIEKKHRATGGVRSRWHFWHRSVFSESRFAGRRANVIKEFF